MEIRFENCCTLTKDALLAMNRKNRNPVFTAAVFVLCAAYLVNGVRAAIAGYPSGLIAPIIAAAVLGSFAYFLPNMQAWSEYRKNLAAYGRDANCITKFYDDKFVVENLTNGKVRSPRTSATSFCCSTRASFPPSIKATSSPARRRTFRTSSGPRP